MENKFQVPENKAEKDNIAESQDSPHEAAFDSIKEIVIKQVSEILGKNEEELTEQEKAFYDKYVAYLTFSAAVSMGAGDFFSERIPSSMNKPKKEYDHKDLSPSIIEMDRFIKENQEDFRKVEDFRDMKKDFKSAVYEKKEGDVFRQTAYNRFVRDDKEVILEELVNNYLRKDVNLPTSTLAAINWKAGIKIYFEQMLPNEYSFIPAEMLKKEIEIDMEKLEKRIKYFPVNLRDYNGTKNSEGDFYQNSFFKQVAYGDLSKKGGLLSLFHEIAHAWQDVYHGENNKVNFESFWKDVSNWLNIINEVKEKFNNGKMMADKYNKLVRDITEKLTNLGVEFDVDNFVYNGQDLEEGSIIITDFKENKYAIKCDKFDGLKKEFEKEERDAWAHALLVLRFLRKGGIDLEPEMKNFSDFKYYIEPCLESYQRSVERKIEIVGRKIGFVKKPKNGNIG